MEIAQLILMFGIPLAEKIWQMSQKDSVTQADWDELKKLAAQSARSQMTDALVAAGIDLTSPQAIALLNLTPK